MDIHRCRFVPFPVSSINALAFNRPHVAASQRSQKSVPVRLAIGRENGGIEIWNPLDGVWHQETTFHGGMGRKVDALVWATEPDTDLGDGKLAFGRSRLFSIGGSSSVTEWDLTKAKARKHASGQHGEIWCLGLQPASPGQAPSRLVVGTGDGCLALYSIDEDDLRLQRILVKSPSKKVHFVSIAFQSRHIVVIGCSDASIRVYDMRNGSMVRKMTLGRDLAGGSKDIIVWCVKALPNGDIVSGDSTGQVCIWDGKTYTQAQRIQSHSQDVLSLAISANGSAILSGGMDRRTVFYKRMPSQQGRWSKVFHRRYHAHDVKAMASFEGRGMSVVISGGSDATPVIIPLREAGLENHRTLSHLPQSVPLLSAPRARLMVSWWGRELQIWKLPRIPVIADSEGDPEVSNPPRVLKKILLKGTFDITSASISEDGSLLAVSTAAELKLFLLVIETNEHGREELRTTRASVPGSITCQGASLVRVSPDGKWICQIREGAEAMLLRTSIDASSGLPYLAPDLRAVRLRRLRRSITSQSLVSGLGGYSRIITHAVFAPNSRMLATADLSGYIDTWVLRDHSEPGGAALADFPSPSGETSDESSDSDGDTSSVGGICQWTRNSRSQLIPKLPAAATILSFSDATPDSSSSQRHPTQDSNPDDYELLAITVTSRVFVFHPLNGMLTTWSRRNPHTQLPEALKANRDLIKGALWQGSRVWLYGVASLFMLDLSQDVSWKQNNDEPLPAEGGLGAKRKRRVVHSGAGGRMDAGALNPHTLERAAGGVGGGEWMHLDVERDDANIEEENRERAADLDDDDAADGGELQLMRAGDNAADEEGANKMPGGLGWWHTYKYRPILGVVLLAPSHRSTAGDSPGQNSGPLEVVLVERPIWDAPLPPRYTEDDREARDFS